MVNIMYIMNVQLNVWNTMRDKNRKDVSDLTYDDCRLTNFCLFYKDVMYFLIFYNNVKYSYYVILKLYVFIFVTLILEYIYIRMK